LRLEESISKPPHNLAAGAAAVGIGADLIPPHAIKTREALWIEELARRYVRTVKHLRQPH